MATISFTVPGIPVAKGRGKVAVFAGHAHIYTPTKTRDAEQTFVARSLEFRPATPLTGALRLYLEFILPLPKSAPRRLHAELAQIEIEHRTVMPHIKKPDLDNLEKLVKDACNGVFWRDDSQVFDVVKSKVYGTVPRTIVRIEEVA